MKRTPLTPIANPDGFILLGVLILIFVMAIIGSAFLALAGSETKASQQDLDSQRAFWLAEGGKQKAIRDLSDVIIWPRPPLGDVNLYHDAAGPDGGTYTVDCLVDTTTTHAAVKAFVLDCVGHDGPLERRVRQRIKMTSFAQYAYFTESEFGPTGEAIWFYSNDIIEGKLHTNGTIRIAGSPRFEGPVTSPSDHMIGYQNYWVTGPAGWPVGTNHPIFDEGFTLNYDQIALPTQTSDLKSVAQSDGVYRSSETDLELGKSGQGASGSTAYGSFRYKDHSAGNNSWTTRQISTLGKLVFYCNNDLHVKGVLDGELTIASNHDIRIEDDITYLASTNGTPNAGCDDMLGVVAGDNVIFVDNAANGNGLIVDGILMALDTSITAENYENAGWRHYLTIWGGLIQKNRGAVGTFGGPHGTTGYTKDYHYDTRVTGWTPPEFPLTGIYEEVAWVETWDASYPF